MEFVTNFCVLDEDELKAIRDRLKYFVEFLQKINTTIEQVLSSKKDKEFCGDLEEAFIDICAFFGDCDRCPLGDYCKYQTDCYATNCEDCVKIRKCVKELVSETNLNLQEILFCH
jgi:hypothetical protein